MTGTGMRKSYRIRARIKGDCCGFQAMVPPLRGRVFGHHARVQLDSELVRQAVQSALSEDIGSGDVTTLATVPEGAVARAALRAREPMVVAGLLLADAAFRELSEALDIR